jgi:CHAT domain-containing protein
MAVSHARLRCVSHDEHFNAALTWRSFERDPRDWAYTEINLGLAYSRRLAGDCGANLQLAIAHYREAIRGFSAVNDDEHVGMCLHNIASEERELSLLKSASDTEQRALLLQAVKHAHASLSKRTLQGSPVGAGRTWSLIGDCLHALGDRDGAIGAYRAALSGLTPTSEPRETARTSRSLANLASEANNWPLAAEAWEIAAEAAARAWESRVTAEGREVELDENVNVFRLAAFALAKAGHLTRAVEVLEMGRARQISTHVATRSLDLVRLRRLNPELERRFVQARDALAVLERQERTGLTVRADNAADIRDEFAATVQSIRAIPGFADFLRSAKFKDLVFAVPPGQVLAYLLSTPSGSLALMVMRKASGLAIVPIEVPALDSGQLVKLFVLLEQETRTVKGYMTAHRDEAELSAAISAFSPNLGALLLRPMMRAILDANATTVCLIPIGLLGLLPLHAIQWTDERGPHCLLDDLIVVFSPSAALRGVALARSADRLRIERAVVVGNPLPQSNPLDGAEDEARAVAAKLPVDYVDVIIGTDAPKDRVKAALPHSEYVHLACHGSASVFGRSMQAALYFANDEPLVAGEVLELQDFGPRLVVASACETAVLQGYESADEVLSLGSMFLAAGAAGVVATLWSVDDYATALLMSRFYEFLGDPASAGPAVALRNAQLWLRALTLDEEEEYLSTHEILRARRATRGRSGDEESPPYSSITMWAAFVYSGA